MEQGGALIPSLFTLHRIAYSIKEDRNDMATWNSRGLRGSTLEDMINKTNEKYRENGLSLIHTDAADERSSVDLGGRRIIKKKNTMVTTNAKSIMMTTHRNIETNADQKNY